MKYEQHITWKNKNSTQKSVVKQPLIPSNIFLNFKHAVCYHDCQNTACLILEKPSEQGEVASKSSLTWSSAGSMLVIWTGSGDTWIVETVQSCNQKAFMGLKQSLILGGEMIMQFTDVCFITNDVLRLRAFYEAVSEWPQRATSFIQVFR